MTAFKQSGGSSGPTGPAGGELAGTFPNPTLKDGVVDDANIKSGGLTDAAIAAANKDGLAAALSLRTLGTGAQQAAGGTDSRFPPTPSGSNGKSLIVAGNAYTLALPKVPGRVFYVSQYSPFNDLVNSDTAAIQAAINACVAAGGGIVVLDHVDWYLNASGGVTGLTHPADFTGQLTIQGLGMTVTSVRLGPRNKTFMCGDTSYSTNTHTYKNLTIQDLTVNARNLNGTDNGNIGSTPYGVVYASQGRCNYENLQFRRIRTVNVGPNMAVGQACTDGISSAAVTRERRNIDITVSTTPEGALGANAFTIKNIIVEDCQFGYSGGGGNCGVLVSAFHGDATSSQRYPNYIWNTPYLSNTTISDVRISRCFHDPGSPADDSTSVLGTTGAFSGLNYMIGQAAQGYNWLIEDCYGANSVDVGIEVDSGTNTVVRGCYIVNAFDAGYYHANIGAGADSAGFSDPDQHTKWINCRSLNTMAITGSFPAPSEAWTCHQPKFASAIGHVSLIDCEAIRNPGSGTWNAAGGQLIEFRGSYRSINIRNLHTAETFLAVADTTVKAATAVAITAMGGRTNINIDGIHDDLFATPSGVSTNALTRTVLSCTPIDGNWNVRNITYSHRWRPTGTYRLTSIGVKNTGSTDFVDTNGYNSGSPSLLRDFVLDAGGGATGAPTDMGVTHSSPSDATANKILVLANPTTEQRVIQVAASGNGTWVGTGPFTDWAGSIKSMPGATISGHKTGIILKRSPYDATTYLEGYVTDNGTNSFLKIDKVLATVRTNLATSGALSTRISNGVQYGLRVKIQGNLVTADYYAAALSAGTQPAVSTAGDNTLTFTLLTTDIAALGEAVQGWGGFSWIAADSAANLDDYGFRRMFVFEGPGIQRVAPQEVIGATTAYGISQTLQAGVWRVRNKLRIRDCDFAALKASTNVGEIRYADGDTAFSTSVDAQGIGYVTIPAAAAVTPPASTVAYTNTSGTRERHFISGGTVSAATLTDGNGTATAVPTAFSGILNSGEALTLTYTVAPTLWNKVILP